ncbi:hypothetical protein [Cyclobacterium plantarum]|uniref:Uncharacterized protein n=1 Tax=Cyclobacterium plantarum TaxID=2716263 RepID=A0ABX0H5R5_9BACT|nr:hypothetical protein [Cyclobacterium plantarum]NHE55787.1 hypothetical protein [Cyclobacterium plantarum]
MNDIKQPLSDVQLEILKAFSHNLTDEELKEFKETIGKYFADRAIQSANKVWDEKGWTYEDVNSMLQTKMRKSKK